MTVALGTLEYEYSAAHVYASGRRIADAERDEALNGKVKELVEDSRGYNRVLSLVGSLDSSGFAKSALEAILKPKGTLEGWRVGEAYAEAYLVVHRRCLFPWPDGWDERRVNSSLPGADLVGLQETSDAVLPHRFAFGEVKTSSDATCPPGVMYGATGLKQQLEDLQDASSIRDTLVLYLAVRAPGTEWQPAFEAAMSRYLKSTHDVAIFGVMIRDVSPNAADLDARCKSLGAKRIAKTHTELLAIYFSSGSIGCFSSHFRSKSKKAGA